MSSNDQAERGTGQKGRYWKAHIENWSKSGLVYSVLSLITLASRH